MHIYKEINWSLSIITISMQGMFVGTGISGDNSHSAGSGKN